MAEASLLQQHFPTLAAFRSSEALRTAARALMDQAMLLPVKRRVHNSYEMGVRVEALLDFIVAACCIPHVFALLGEGSPATSKQQQQRQQEQQQQENPQQAKTSYESSQLMLQECLQYFKDAHQEYLAQGGTDEQLDDQRTRLVVEVVNYRRVPWVVSFSRTVESHLPPLLGTMARHLLVVANLCGEVTRKIESVTLTVRRKVASSQEVEEGEKLDPLNVVASHVSEFWAWLRENRVRLVPLCRVTELVTSLDPVLRNSLKNEHYTSPEQFLDVFNTRYRSTLNRLPVPLLEWTRSDHEQAMKDVTREHVILNKRRISGTELREQLYDIMHPLVHEYLRALCTHYAASHSGSSVSNDGSSDVPEAQLAKEATDLTWRVVDHIIVSSARTVSCGDMLLLLQDLFGGEGLVLTPHGKDPIDVTIQVNDDGDVVMEAAEQFHLVEADQRELQDKHLDVLMTFRTNAITSVKLNRCPRCRADVPVRVTACNDQNVESKADISAASSDSEEAEEKAGSAAANASTRKPANGHKRALQHACADVFERLMSLSQRHMCVLPLLPLPPALEKSISADQSTVVDDEDDGYDV